MTLLQCHIENVEFHQLGRPLDPPFVGLFQFRRAADDQIYRIVVFGHIVEVLAWEQELSLTY